MTPSREPADPHAATEAHDTVTIPTRVTFRGMPNPRWWQQEDAAVDVGGVQANPADLARGAVLQFALVYGNDQFVVRCGCRSGRCSAPPTYSSPTPSA